MKISDVLRIGARIGKGRWAVVSAVGMAAGMFCLCFAGAGFAVVTHEKSLPQELAISAEGMARITDGTIARIREIDGVINATPLKEAPVMIGTGEYKAQLTMAGMDAAYFDGTFTKGSVFPVNTVMPYIVLNEAACGAFSDGKGSSDQAPDIDWLDSGFWVRIGDSAGPVTSRVCGILRGGGKEPMAYVSLSAAGKLWDDGGIKGDASARVRILNTGYAEKVAKSIQGMGFGVSDPDTDQRSRWDLLMKEARYLAVVGVSVLLCAAVLISAWRRISTLEQRDAWEMLRWLGMEDGDITGLCMARAGATAASGAAAGLAAALCLPFFLGEAPDKGIAFALSVPFGVAAVCAVLCIALGVLSAKTGSQERKEDTSHRGGMMIMQ